MDGGGSSDMTLGFEIDALKQLSKPDEAVQNARTWSEYVGVLADEPTHVVTNFTRQHRIRQDFFSGPRGKGESLASVKAQFDTERYVFIGTDEHDEQLAEEHDWEYLPIEDAAENADWQLATDVEERKEQFAEEPERDDWP
jgi:hypothetical protein